ncbi:HAMP domain-containing sensor histidine kinase [Klugiella xanthotipulae]|uniref:histidine kinase n=1 Tax=Klugiella xanthotipulae TaxID=244735 RepID=A0A543I451_9MICO|nr:HAMP domain-containing sensor histidine kinase [Klugiella xanthotipulae]TQM65369.1 signal transduction histidine kinase [Klugiella xanthotipulae]
MSSRVANTPGRTTVRLALQFSGLMLCVLVFVSVLVYSIVAASTREENERTLRAAALVDAPDDAPAGVYAIFVGGKEPHRGGGGAGGSGTSPTLPTGLPDDDALAAVAAGRGEVWRTLSVNHETFLVLTTQSKGRIAQVAVNTHETEEELQRLLMSLVGGGLAATLVAGLLSLVMARRAVRPLTEALAIQRRFISDASHELRTPLTLISTRAQLLRRRTATQRGDTSGLDDIVRDASLLTEILEDLLLAADPREDSARETVDLGAVAEQAVTALHGTAAERTVELRATRTGTRHSVRGLPVPLLRLVTALVTNAIDHAEKLIIVEVSAGKNTVVLRVSDDGPGFPPGEESRLFERFASIRETRPEHGRHYGLGLAIVSEIATRFEGTVSVEQSGPNRGATICVSFPAA